MALVTPSFVSAILNDFEEKEGFWEVAITDALRTAAEGYKFADQEERDAWWAESAAFSFALRTNGDDSVWSTAFGPLFSATRQDGSAYYAPDIAETDAETVHYWEMRSAEARHPVLVARYSDLVWDFTKVVTGCKPEIAAAQISIDCYLRAADLQYPLAVQPIGYLNRALDLALSIGDKDRVSTVVAAIFALYEKVATPGRTGSWIFLFDALYGNKKVGLSRDHENTIIKKLEEMLLRCSDRTSKEGFDPWGAQAAGERLERYYRRAGEEKEIERVIRTFCRAFEQIAGEASPLLAMGWLQPVYETYLRAGMRPDATRVQLLLKEKGKDAHKDMKTMSAKIEISKEEMERFLTEITAGGLDTALLRIAVQFTTKTALARDLMKKLAEEAPLQAMIGIQKIGDAQIIAQAGSVKDDPEGRTIWQLAQIIEFESGFLSECLRLMRERYSPNAEELTAFLYRSPVFDEMQRSLITEGVDAYIKEDFVKAIHILVPQIENSLRHLLGLIGVPTNKLMRSAKGVMQEKTLNDLLAESAIRATLEEDTINYLQTFLNDPRGQNVRNRVSHGLCRREFFGRLVADRVLHILLSLSRLAKTSDPGQPADRSK